MLMDRLIIEFDKGLRTLFSPARSVRPIPGAELPDTVLTDVDRKHAAALMRINHCGEVCAQALYQGQAITSQDDQVRRELDRAAAEETEHLAWTELRIAELGGRKSLLNPLWYMGSLTMGVAVGKLGDRWNLGFLAETERQVEAHLKGHLDSLPDNDLKSRAIVSQMKEDESRHADTAVGLGAHVLPYPAKVAMNLMSRVMTGLSYRV